MRHRLFLALPFPEDLRSKIQDLRSKIHQNLLWEPTEKLHLTLNFIGNTYDDQLPNLQKHLQSVICPLSSFQTHFGFLQAIYRRHEGSYLCLTPDQKSEQLISLQENLTSAIYKLDIPVADRFWPHLLIARLPKADPVTIKALLDKIDALDLRVRFTWLVDSVVLFESKSDRAGTHYSRLATYPLFSTSPRGR